MTNDEFVAVVDDDDMLREMSCFFLQSLQMSVVEYASAVDFLADPNWRKCACLVLDIRMPYMSGIELQRRLKREDVSIPIVFVTAHGDVPLVVEAMREGAVDYLQKPINALDLVDRVQKCLLERNQQRKLIHDKDVAIARLACLTPREREVFDQLAVGRRSKQIADTLGVSLKTVEEYRSKVLHKMHATSTPDLLSRVVPLLRLASSRAES